MNHYKLSLVVVLSYLLGCSDDTAKNQTNISTPNISPVSLDNQTSTIAVVKNKKWQLMWHDEFNEQTIDLTKWSFEVNCFGGGNDEQQCYTDRKDNAYIDQGILNIVALKENFTGPAVLDDSPNYSHNNTRTLPYTSARLRSKNKGDWTYGRFEVRAKLPQGQGTWPAIWMLPTDWAYGAWAGSGEIDIMEAVNLKAQSDEKGAPIGKAEARIHGTLHYGRAAPENIYAGRGVNLPNDANPADDFHEYAIEWQAGEIRWYVDNIHFSTQRDTSWYSQYINDDGLLVNGAGSAPFDQKFHLLLNFAVGGNWPANVNEKGIDQSVFPQSLEIDYVRVYQCTVSPLTGAGCETIDEDALIVTGAQAPEL